MKRPPTARKRFGQHFLESSETIRQIVASIVPEPGQTLLEIGPGRGALTRPLADSGVSLHAIEFDRDLVPGLREQFAGDGNVTIIEADALRFDYASLGPSLRVVGNLPYNISTPLLFRFIEFRDSIGDLHCMLQKEVVDRLAAAPGSGAYGRLTIMSGAWLHVQKLFDVPPTAFAPPPRVVSSVVRLWPRTADAFVIRNPQLLRDIVTRAFSQRRKTLRNALKAQAAIRDLEALDIDPGARAEQIPIASWVDLANRLAENRRN